MITKEELKAFYENQLQDKLKGLEEARKKVKNGFILAVLMLVIPILAFIFLAQEAENSSSAPLVIILFIAFFITGLVFLYKTNKKRTQYRQRYKNEVVREIVNAIDSDWNYAPDDHISPNEYYSSDLFRKSYDRYKGDDLISGKIEKTDFRCSELHTQYREVTTDSKGNRKERWVTIFRGLFFHADFNKNIQAQTYIEPDSAERLLGKFGQKFQLSTKGKLVKLENPEFEKIFAVFSTDQNEARYILTPAIMEALVNIYNMYKRKMYMSFIGSRVYVAMKFNKGLFEPRIFGSGAKYEDVEFMFNLFMMNTTIIHELNLNTRIWTKE